MPSVTPFISEPLAFDIRDGVMHVAQPNGDWRLATPLAIFRTNMRNAQQAIDAYDAKTFPREPGDGIPPVLQ